MSTASSSSRSSLSPSTRLGPYEITAPLGAGGMGEVYRARDTRLDREVAIKLLPPQLAADPQFRARFEREAKSVSALNHPHICTLHDLGSATVGGEELHYLVLELIEGESLAQRLAKGPLPVEDVLRYGGQVASALDAAHRQAIVHRDLKPGNVMITKTGAKLLDFGLARSSDGQGVVEAISSLNTVDKPLTEQGTIVGTFQYMAPEQLEGLAADARTDIFALGALLYEMATGRKAFDGKSRTSLIAAIISSHPPPISTAQAMTPPALDHVVRKCLEKDPDDRWQSARDVMAELHWIAEGGSRVGLPGIISTRRKVREGLAWGAFAVAGLAAVGFAVAWARRAPQPAPVVRFQIPNPDGVTDIGPPVISPDGRIIAFDATDVGGKRQIWIRPLDALESRPLSGTEGALRPIWSPDSRAVAFVAGDKLRRASVAGGPAQTIADVQRGADGTWSPQGVILFDGQTNDPVWRVDAAGGVPKPLVTPDPTKGMMGAGFPVFLPGGRYFLHQVTMANPEENTLVVRALDGTESKTLLKTTSQVIYAAPGYLLFVRDRTLVAQPFDPQRREIRGEPIPLGEGLGLDNVGLASISASTNRVLAYRPGQAARRRLVWVDRSGKEIADFGDEREYVDTWLSPDGRRVAFGADAQGDKGDIWIRDSARGTTTRFTFGPERAFDPVWSPDGRRIAFSMQRKNWDLYVKDAAGTGEAELLLESAEDKFVTDWTRDGAYVVFSSRGKDTTWDLWAMPTAGGHKPFPLRKTKFSELNGSVSPDGRFLAYQSNESGRVEVYVQEFPEAKSKWQVSPDGGRQPFWRGDGRELYYLAPNAKLMVVPVEKGPGFTTGTPQALFQARFAPLVARGLYRPTPDGQRFLILSPLGRDAMQPATVILNWTSGIQQGGSSSVP
ncbi:MAG: protein kinase [Vicinamibacteria bacterium]